ncbi:RidA family protein [Roseisalinus antarcticus]|uniref:Endoribonuclease L-PSP n=1 Tax=Roseisalinus antarcticus TaxID=254357 RepID=A0A1Y5T5F3_9RHOB|nr:RidA family protein [Roseisalinus antarcticus]SLN56294.1 Endoribonuclease L-PSP [Roseisalinus antarcticus]
MTGGVPGRMAAAGLVLPPLSPAIGNFERAVEVGPLLYVSGQAPLDAAGRTLTGKADVVGLIEARRRAGLTALSLLASVDAVPGRLERLDGVVRLLGMVNAGPGFAAADSVLDGCSDLFETVLPGGHARTTIVLPSLPGDITVEIEAVFRMTKP